MYVYVPLPALNLVIAKVYELRHLGVRLDCCLFVLLDSRFLLGGNEIFAVLQFCRKRVICFPFFRGLGWF